MRTPEARAWGRLSSAPTVSGGEGLQARPGFASWCPSACPQPAGLSARSPAARPVTVSAPPTEGGTVVGRLHAQGRVGGTGFWGGGGGGGGSEHSRGPSTAGVTCTLMLLGGSSQAATSRPVPVGCWPVVASSREDEQCIPAHCLTHACFRSLKRWESSPPHHNNRKKGQSHWLSLGSRRDSFQIDHAHQRGVTMATP